MSSITAQCEAWAINCPKCKREFTLLDDIEGKMNEGEICYCPLCVEPLI